MKTLLIKNLKGIDEEINFRKVTQFLGSNVERKEYIINSIVKHFSHHKYDEEESKQENNIRIDEQEVGRNYFKLTYISNIRDIETQFSVLKSSMLVEYLNSLVEKIEIKEHLARLNNEIERIMNELNRNIDIDLVKCNIEMINYDLNALLKNNLQFKIYGEDNVCLEYTSNLNKCSSFLDLLVKLNIIMPKKHLIIFNNIDNYLNNCDYKDIVKKMKQLCRENDFYFIASASREGCNYIDEELIEGINTINDVVFNIPSFSVLKSYIVNHYPCNCEFEQEDLISILEPIIGRLGMNKKSLDIQSQVVLKLLNGSVEIDVNKPRKSNKIEIDYIFNERNMV